MKLLLFTDETENEKAHTTMQAMSKKQIKKIQIIWETAIIQHIKQIMTVNHNELYCQTIKVQKINHKIQVQFNYDYCK